MKKVNCDNTWTRHCGKYTSTTEKIFQNHGRLTFASSICNAWQHLELLSFPLLDSVSPSDRTVMVSISAKHTSFTHNV